jgi:hypothetical protein
MLWLPQYLREFEGVVGRFAAAPSNGFPTQPNAWLEVDLH